LPNLGGVPQERNATENVPENAQENVPENAQ
jgi:hypothetical protein